MRRCVDGTAMPSRSFIYDCAYAPSGETGEKRVLCSECGELRRIVPRLAFLRACARRKERVYVADSDQKSFVYLSGQRIARV